MRTRQDRIAHELREAITSGEYPPGSMLPALPELIAQYGVARDTVRGAISTLANEGLVVPQSGVGTVVRDTSPVNLNSSLGNPHPVWSATAGEDGATVIAEAEWVQAGPELTERLAVATGEDLVRRVKIYYKGRHVALTHEQWIPSAVARAIAEHLGYDAADKSSAEPSDLYTMMRGVGFTPSSTTETVTARMPDPDEREVMGIPAGIPVLLTERVTNDPDGRPLETSDFAGPADRTAQTYTVAIPSP